MKKIVLVGANGTVGKHVAKVLTEAGHEVIKVGKKSGDFQADIANAESIAKLFEKVGKFDALVNASGDVAFVPVDQAKAADWNMSFQSKLMGQINLVQQALPYINEGGSFSLISGILGDEQIAYGTIAATVNKALEGFVQAAACELPKKLRINLISPTVLEDSLGIYGNFFPGFNAAKGSDVAAAFKKSVMGIQTGQVYKIYG